MQPSDAATKFRRLSYAVSKCETAVVSPRNVSLGSRRRESALHRRMSFDDAAAFLDNQFLIRRFWT